MPSNPRGAAATRGGRGRAAGAASKKSPVVEKVVNNRCANQSTIQSAFKKQNTRNSQRKTVSYADDSDSDY